MGFINKLLGSSSKGISVLEADKMLRRTNELANIANKTTNRDEFYQSINEIKSILRELSKYEGKLPFSGSPSADLRELERMEEKQIELLEKRIEEKEKHVTKDELDTSYGNELIRKADALIKREDVFMSGVDELLSESGRFIILNGKASIGLIMRKFQIGFNRAAKIMNQLEDIGVVGPESGTAPRKIIATIEEYEKIIKDFEKRVIHENKKEDTHSTNQIDLYNNQFDYMEGHDFEYFCAELLRKNGFSDVKVTQGSGDQGIDILATKDGIKYGIQCKCYSSDIGNKAVQEVFSGKSFYNCHVGVVLTNRYFTSSAKKLAEKNGILLWDRDKLEEMVGRGNG